MSRDIVERLRSRNTEIPHRYPSPPPHGEFLAFECAACGEMVDILDDESVCSVGWRGPYLEHEAADEIERLRALITAWADADDVVERDYQFRDWDALEYGGDQRELSKARDALRKAVGR